MIKLLALLAFLSFSSSLVAALPFISHEAPFATIAYHQPALATVSAVVETVPTSVSHNSHAVVHKSERVAQDVLAPAIRSTFFAPVSYTSYGAAPNTYTSYADASPYA